MVAFNEITPIPYPAGVTKVLAIDHPALFLQDMMQEFQSLGISIFSLDFNVILCRFLFLVDPEAKTVIVESQPKHL
jgi:hypothetical protein